MMVEPTQEVFVDINPHPETLLSGLTRDAREHAVSYRSTHVINGVQYELIAGTGTGASRGTVGLHDSTGHCYFLQFLSPDDHTVQVAAEAIHAALLVFAGDLPGEPGIDDPAGALQ